MATDWIGLYDYPTHLRALEPGESIVFLCPMGWQRGLVSTMLNWARTQTDWRSRFPRGRAAYGARSTRVGINMAVTFERAPLPGTPYTPPPPPKARITPRTQ